MTRTSHPGTAHSDRDPLPLLYAPRWRWPERPLLDAPLSRPLDILGVLPPRDSLGPFAGDGLPEPLTDLSPAAVLAALAVADGLLPANLRLSGAVQPPPLRVALFGPGAAAVLSIVRSIFGPLPPERIFSAHAVRDRCDPEEPALPPGVWPLLCGPQKPQSARGVGSAGLLPSESVRTALRGFSALPEGIPCRDRTTTRALCRMTADESAGSPLLAAPARAMSGALPFLHDRLYLILMAIHAAIHGEPVHDPFSPLAGEVGDSTLDLAGSAFADLVSFYARVRPPPATPALRLAAAILRDRPCTVARTTCGVAGVSTDDLQRLAAAGWLEMDETSPRGGRWPVSEELRSMPPLSLDVLKRSPEPVAVLLRALHL